MEGQILKDTNKYVITNYDEHSEGKLLGAQGIMETSFRVMVTGIMIAKIYQALALGRLCSKGLTCTASFNAPNES